MCLPWVRRPLGYYVELSLTIVNYQALGSINSLVDESLSFSVSMDLRVSGGENIEVSIGFEKEEEGIKLL